MAAEDMTLANYMLHPTQLEMSINHLMHLRERFMEHLPCDKMQQGHREIEQQFQPIV